MGDDSRIKDLGSEVLSADIQALLNTLFLAVDDTSFTDAKKILLKSILTEAVVSSNANNYQALTPKAFYDSVMTTARKGVGRYATSVEVTGKTSDGLLRASDQDAMQTQWISDLMRGDGMPAAVYGNAYARQTFTNQYGNSMSIGDALEIYDAGSSAIANMMVILTIGAGETVLQGTYSVTAASPGTASTVSLGTYFDLYVDSTRKKVQIKAKQVATYVRVSAMLVMVYH